ncbi:MAG: hypothetical protein V1847_05170 [Candidatus Diapherotrites archaeon]
MKKKFVERKGAHYFLADPSGIVSLIGLERDMDSLLVKKLSVNLPKKKILQKVSGKGVLCLDSALEKYSNYYRSNRVCIYATEKQVKEIETLFQGQNSGHAELLIFKPDFEPETEKGKKATSRLRTLIDLVCDNKTFYAKDLFKQLWKVEMIES